MLATSAGPPVNCSAVNAPRLMVSAPEGFAACCDALLCGWGAWFWACVSAEGAASEKVMSVKSFSFPTAIGADAAAAVRPGALLSAGVDAGLFAEGTGEGGILLPIGVDAGLFMGVTEATLACIEGVIRGVWGAVAGP